MKEKLTEMTGKEYGEILYKNDIAVDVAYAIWLELRQINR